MNAETIPKPEGRNGVSFSTLDDRFVEPSVKNVEVRISGRFRLQRRWERR
jgi:hypothetical protein